MAIAENKLRNWIDRTRHVAQNVEKPEDLSAVDVLRALTDAIPHLREDKIIFEDMELNELFDEAYRTINSMDEGLDKVRDIAAKNKVDIEAIANIALEKYQPLL